MTGAEDQQPAEVDVTEALVRALLAEQHPDLADRPLIRLDAGWDNVIFRLGDDLLVRLPRRDLAAPLIVNEQRWLPELAHGLPLPVPVPVRTGVPTASYPWHWSVSPWFPGRSALTEPPAEPAVAAELLGRFLARLHQPAPAGYPANPYRGIPLTGRHDLTVAAIDLIERRWPGRIDAAGARACWEHHVALPPWDGPPLWLHGDLHPHNVVVHEGEVSAVIDFGDITAGDPATDLGIAWMLFAPEVRPALRAAAGVDDGTWQRGRGWALALGLAYLAGAASTPEFLAVGQETVAAVLADPDPARDGAADG